MLKHRGYVVVGLIVLISAGVAVGLTSYWLRGPFDPNTASQTQLLRWLALNDVSERPEEFQLTLVDRLAGEIRQGIDAEPSSDKQSRYHDQLWRNAQSLKKRWFVSRSHQHAELATEDKPAFLDREITTVLSWARLEAKWSPENEASDSAAAFVEELDAWISNEQDATLKAKMSNVVRDGTIRWLATHDLGEHSMATRRLLVRRIANELDKGLKPAEVGAGLPTDQSDQLRANGLLLTEAWLHEQADAYALLEQSSERASFIDDQIEKFHRWGLIAMVSQDESTADENPAAAFASFGKQVSLWIERADPNDQPRLKKLMSDVQGRVFLRMLQGTLLPRS